MKPLRQQPESFDAWAEVDRLQRERRDLRRELGKIRHAMTSELLHGNRMDLHAQIARIDKALKSKRKVKAK